MSNAATLRRDAFHAGLAILSAGHHVPPAVLEAYDAALAAVSSSKDRIKIAQRVGLFCDEKAAGKIPRDALIEKTLPLDLDGHTLHVTIDACWMADDCAVIMDWSDPTLDTLELAARALAWAFDRGASVAKWVTATCRLGQVTYDPSPVLLELEIEGLWKRVRSEHMRRQKNESR